MGIESAYLHWLRARLGDSLPNTVQVGIGDDAAVVQSPAPMVICTDTVIEGVHFTADSETEWRQAGRKALAVNLSDIAAMGARPIHALLNLVVRPGDGLAIAKSVTSGLLDLADQFQVTLVGGDTCTSSGPVTLSVTVTGELLASEPLMRHNVSVDDVIVVTGPLGGSLQSGKHWNFAPRCREIARLLEQVTPGAATDITDGLVRDLASMVQPVGLGFVLDANRIPVSDAARSGTNLHRAGDYGSELAEQVARIDGLFGALNDGEDFELLMTFSIAQWDCILQLREKGWDPGCDLIAIGKVTSQDEWSLQFTTGETYRLPLGGYDH